MIDVDTIFGKKDFYRPKEIYPVLGLSKAIFYEILGNELDAMKFESGGWVIPKKALENWLYAAVARGQRA